MTQPPALPDRFKRLAPEQQDLATELTARAEALHRDADGELSLAEAVTLAAVQMGRHTWREEIDR